MVWLLKILITTGTAALIAILYVEMINHMFNIDRINNNKRVDYFKLIVNNRRKNE